MTALPPTLGPREGRRLERLLRRPSRAHVVLDGRALLDLDAAGAALLAALYRRCRAAGGSLVVEHLSERCRRVLDGLPAPPPAPPPSEPLSVWAAVGGGVEAFVGAFVALVTLSRRAAGALWAWALGRARPPPGECASQAYRLGAGGLPMVATILMMVGATVALQSAQQLRQFGAQIFVADLLGISVLRELGPLITAVVMAGRSGAALAAELAAMVVGEEIDALTTMGIDPFTYLVVPRLVGFVVTLPLLAVLGDATALMGGAAVARVAYDIPLATFLDRLEASLVLGDFTVGVGKSVVFAWIIVAWGTAAGLRAGPGAAGVGSAATRSVVGSIFAIVAANAAMGALFAS